ncbi:all-trans retinoic acid-induced differentiation factor [Numida meleagris]|uniref:all-trans retinoic acid-induced differentiation factor n=1 Tax=Numida meleagris TaxID=8996 RepID=UPI000B3DBA28|nr:all-trans retinoic acid-induced differentiation factor [Numida meleagris]
MAEPLAAARGRFAPPRPSPLPGGAHPGAASERGGAAGSGAVASLLLLLLLLLLPPGAGGTPPRLCGSCPGPPRNGSVVAQFCASRADSELWGRCCVGRGSGRQHLLGLDLSSCSLRALPSAFSEAAAAVVLDLTENPLAALPDGSFLGFTQLQQLVVPLSVPCPGGSGAWEEVTTYGSGRLCQGQRNPCNGSEELVPLCPENAACAPDGPGFSQCLCAGPFHGYKCLRQGAFPVPLFCSVLGTVTAALSLALWGTQRRHAAGP